ncbi:MAG: peptide deformylase [Deltaproteobacteria bacterium]|nr:peptide deformylase [Deltaproteobacteria bacterium]
MSILPIVKYPEPVLMERSSEVDKITDDLRSFISDMEDTLYASEGVGLAAVQVNKPIRIFVIDPTFAGGTEEDDTIIFINPEIIHTEGEVREEEGCLSFPGVFVPIKRFKKCTVKATDLNGNEFTMEGTGLLSRAFQHETDHLNGKLIIDHIGPLKKKLALRRLQIQ